METILELSDRFQKLDAEARTILADLISRLPFKPSPGNLHADSEILTERLQSKFMLIGEGRVSCIRSNILLFIFGQGDLLGLDSLLALDDIRLQTTFAVPVLEIPKKEFFAAVDGNLDLQKLWCRYLSLQIDMMTMIAGYLMKGEFDPGTSIKTFREGDTIIKQGNKDNDVFTLVEGRADVMFDNVKVGEIADNELFGVLSALGNIPRTASVIARRTCTVVAMPKEHFIEFFKSRPAAVLKMVEDMALTIVKLNQRVAKESGKSPTHRT
jgi:CRP/FNR family cyclic AMP-dependent transcriptional regulator